MSFDIYTRRRQLGLSLEDIGKRVGVSKSTVKKWESGFIENMKRDKIALLADVLQVSPLEILGIDPKDTAQRIADADLVSITGMISVYGAIHCGDTALAVEHVEGHVPTTLAHPERYFALRARGDSMSGAGIVDGSTVILRKQDWADSGEIVACGLAGELATLKRMKVSGNTILLLPENPAYEPIVLTKEDFDNGEAYILGVAVEVSRKL